MIIKDYPAYSIFYREMNCWLIGGLVGTLRDPDYIQPASRRIREIREPKHD